MGELTLEQRRALALASARMRMAESEPEGGALRTAEFAARGVRDSAMETIGAIPDAVAAGMRYVGLPAPEEGYYTDKLKSGAKAVGQTLSRPLNDLVDFGPDAPSNPVEEGAYGAGRGVADAASFMAPGLALAKGAKAGSVAQGVGKTMASMPVAQAASGAVGGAVTEVTDNPLLGAAAAVMTPAGIGAGRKAISPVGRKLTGEEARLAKLAEASGINLTPGQATGSRPLQAVEAAFSQMPFTAGKQAKIFGEQRTAFNRAIMRTAGVDADNAAPEVLSKAFQDIGRVFDDVTMQTSVKVDAKLANDIRSAYQRYTKRLPTDVRPVFKSYVDDMMQAVKASKGRNVTGVTIDGATYKTIASDLRDAARNARSNPDLKNALGDLSKALDDAMGRSVSGRVKDTWLEARRRYRNLLIIDGAMAMAPQADAAAGNIPFGALKNAVRQADKSGFARGRGEMNDLSRVGTFLGSTAIPDSGTAIRSNAMNMLKGGPVAAGAGGPMAMGASPEAIALGAGVGLAAPPAAQAIMNSKVGQAYLRNNLASQRLTPEQMRQLMGKVLIANQAGQATN